MGRRQKGAGFRLEARPFLLERSAVTPARAGSLTASDGAAYCTVSCTNGGCMPKDRLRRKLKGTSQAAARASAPRLNPAPLIKPTRPAALKPGPEAEYQIS